MRDGLFSRAAPFAAIMLVAVAVLPLEDVRSTPDLVAAAVVTAVIVVAVVLVPWERLPPAASACPPLGYLIVVALLRDGTGGTGSIYSPMVLLPVVWFALHGTRAQLLLCFAGVAAVFTFPILLIGDPAYPAAAWARVPLWLLLAATVGGVVQSLVQDVRDRAELARSIVESAHEAFISIDEEGRIIEWNSQAEVDFGYTRDEAIGRSLAQTVIPPRHRRAHHRGVQRFLLLGEGPLLNKRIEITAWHRDGYEFPVELTIAPLRTDDGYVFNAFLHDITARKRAEADIKRASEGLAEAQQIAHVGSWEWDLVANEVTWSDEFCRIHGLEQDAGDASYDAFLARIHPDDRAAVRAAIQSAIAGEDEFSCRHRVVRDDGAVRTVDARGGAVLDDSGRPLRLIGTAHDVTESRAVEDALRRASGELERSNAELERSNAELEQFAYLASHDLAEPLHVVSGFVELLGDRYGDRIGENGQALIRSALSGVARMHDLIDALLRYSRVGQADLRRTAVDCSTLVADACEELRSAIEAKRASVETVSLPSLAAEPTLLRQVFHNLISNAIKFSAGDDPRITISATRERESWRLSVRDNGVGVAQGDAERVFEIFERLHGRSVPGTGIGLAVCKRIVERHGGRIWVEPAAGGGSVFHFTIADADPAERAPELAAGMPPLTVPDVAPSVRRLGAASAKPAGKDAA